MKHTLKALVVASLALMLASTTAACRSTDHSGHEEHHGDDREETDKGPHGGRIFTCGALSAELAIFEQGSSPHFRLYTSEDGKTVPPGDVSASVTVNRLGGAVDTIGFAPVGDFLEGIEVVYEPHSFDVSVKLSARGKKCEWAYSSYEGRTTIPADVAARSGIRTEIAGPRVMQTTIRARGKIIPSEHRIAHIIPRFSGVVREGRKHVGDSVEKGEVVAVIESNQSLQPFEVKSQVAGTVITGHLIVGEFVPDNQWIFIVADLSVVWADLFLPLRESKGATVGQVARISSVNSDASADGRVIYVAPYADEKSQSRLVRVEIPNPNTEFLPGSHVTGDLVAETTEVPVAVRKDAVQRFRHWLVVFKKVGDTYEVRPVELGRTDGDRVEITSGLAAGEEYVTSNAFLVKADVLKSGATHDH